jgi:hypothetical protein
LTRIYIAGTENAEKIKFIMNPRKQENAGSGSTTPEGVVKKRRSDEIRALEV